MTTVRDDGGGRGFRRPYVVGLGTDSSPGPCPSPFGFAQVRFHQIDQDDRIVRLPGILCVSGKG